MKFTKTKKLIAVLGAAALMLSGCGNSAEDAFMEKILPDFEAYTAATDHNRALYEEIVSAVEEYIQNPNEETKAVFFETQEKNVKAINENLHLESSLEDEEKSVLREYNISEEDYASMFGLLEYYSQELTDWDRMNLFVENGIVAAAEVQLELELAEYDYDQKNFYYATMEMFAEIGDKNIEDVKEMLEKYPTVVRDDIEWLTNLEEIQQKEYEGEAEYAAAIDEYNTSMNDLEIEQLELKQLLGEESEENSD